MTILGIDPGSRFTGFGVIQVQDQNLISLDSGVIVLPQKLNFAQKLELLLAEMDDLIRRYQPNTAVVEKIFLGKNADSAFKLGHVRGVCLAAAARHQVEVVEYAARTVKKVVTGSGAADKQQVRLLLTQMLKLKDQVPDLLDASDALALAYCHSEKLRVTNQMSAQQKDNEL